MIDIPKIEEIKEIPIDDLVVGKSQVRLSDVGKDIHELAESISKVGLLEPIMVAPSESQQGKFEIILGQRRFLAHKELGIETILSVILDRSVDEITAKILSVTENLVRRDLNRKDLIDVCTYLYKKYGSMATVAEETGLPYGNVSNYVKYDRLIPELREIVDTNPHALQTALRVQDALDVTGEIDPEEAVKLAKSMTEMSGAQQKKIVEEIKEKPESDVDNLLEEAQSGGKITQIIVTFGQQAHSSLAQYAKDEGTSLDDAARSLVEDALSVKGYLGEGS